MDNSLKIGAFSGLIAGIIAGIIFSIFITISLSMGFWETPIQPLYQNHYGVNILIGIFWGIICGIIYSKTYNLIPGKSVLKGLCFGLIILSIMELRQSNFFIAYGWTLIVAGLIFTGFFKWIVYGSVLGYLYKKE